MCDVVEVWLDAPLICERCQVGMLASDQGLVRFMYAPAWLDHAARFLIDPSLLLDAAPFFPKHQQSNFGILLDSAPDLWGQTLMKRREALETLEAGRAPRALGFWDFLLGVQDLTRQGALRFRRPQEDRFLDDHPLAAPPVTRLAELQAMATALSDKRLDDLDALRRWLAVLVASGASLGGARPKANFQDTDGALWIAKFPARDDERDVGAWEFVVHQLAQQAGIQVPPARLMRLGTEHHAFCVQRFDRALDARVFYSSGMSLLGKDSSDEASYLEIAEFIQTRSGQPDADLAQLYRRVVFNVAVSNRDDHLRNHGFLLTPEGWRLSPAFDVNPSLDMATHVLNLDDGDNWPDLETVLATAPFYGLDASAGERIIDEILAVVQTWPVIARQAGISAGEIALMAGAFVAPRRAAKCASKP